MPQEPTASVLPLWLRRAVELGYSPIAMANMLGTTPANVLQLVRSLPTTPAELRRLARKLGIDYESLRTFTDNALQPITGFDPQTQKMLRLWEKLDQDRRDALLLVAGDMARGRRAKRKGTAAPPRRTPAR